jgi:hypothetical protein
MLWNHSDLDWLHLKSNLEKSVDSEWKIGRTGDEDME